MFVSIYTAMDMNIKLLFNVALIFIQTIKAIFSDYNLFDFENSYSDEHIRLGRRPEDPDDPKGRNKK